MAGHRSWVLKSLAMNAVGAALDYSVLLTAREGFDLAPVAATALGLTVGSTTSFLLNRRFAFGDARGGMMGQALRFALAMVVLLAVHSFAVNALCEGLALHVVLAKMVADLTVLPVPQALLLRRFVFPTLRRTATAEQRLALP
jgi:putative flippase GtrA